MRLIAPFAVLFLLGVPACGTQEGANELRRIAATAHRPVYWLGEHFRGLPLTEVKQVGEEITVIYGTCDPNPTCTTPIALQQTALSQRHPSMFSPNIWCKRYRVRGALAAHIGGFDIYTGNTTVTIYAQKGLIFPAAYGLRRVGDTQRKVGARLPPSPARVARELESCKPR